MVYKVLAVVVASTIVCIYFHFRIFPEIKWFHNVQECAKYNDVLHRDLCRYKNSYAESYYAFKIFSKFIKLKQNKSISLTALIIYSFLFVLNIINIVFMILSLRGMDESIYNVVFNVIIIIYIVIVVVFNH